MNYTDSQNEQRKRCQVMIVGSGVAGSTAALTLAKMGIDVMLLYSGESYTSGNSVLAQGGIIYTGPGDSPDLLAKDLLTCGWEYNSLEAVRFLAENGPKVVKEILIDDLQVPFNLADNGQEWHLTKEGGHSLPRILHCRDFTGKAIMDALHEAVAAHPNVRILPTRTAVDLLTTHHNVSLLEYRYHLSNRCLGAYVINEELNRVETILADYTILATGGIGQIFLHTTNSRHSVGSALAMVSRAGGKLMNLEFIQFHPTVLFHHADRRSLITEALRGEGARLKNEKGETFMDKVDPRADLAPRDIVTRAILNEMHRTGSPCVFLDAANYVPDLAKRFPTILAACQEINIDITSEPIPVVPAAHYSCGGVLADLNGRTTIEGLYAIGECACTGLHGANRLASSSLLECLLWGVAAANDVLYRLSEEESLPNKLLDSVSDWISPGNNANEDPALIAQDWASIKNTMWNYVGISRSSQRLKRAFDGLRDLSLRIHDFYKETPMSQPIVELFHGCQAAYMTTLSAMLNKNSLGCHYRED